MVIFVSFILLKGYLRTPILNSNPPEFIKIFVLSYPNFCEAVLGSIVLIGIGLVFNKRVIPESKQLNKAVMYKISLALAAVYVILQEFKVHNIGGKNVYDPYDVFFSIIGIVVAYLLVHKYQPYVE